MPFSLAPSNPPLTNKLPKFKIKQLAPPPNTSIRMSYTPTPANTHPTITNKVVIWPGVNLVFKYRISPKRHIIEEKCKHGSGMCRHSLVRAQLPQPMQMGDFHTEAAQH